MKYFRNTLVYLSISVFYFIGNFLILETPVWAQTCEDGILCASDSASDDRFGYTVSGSGDLAIIGAVGDDDNGSFSGSAYIYRWDGTDWVEEQKLTASDGAEEDWYGLGVSINGDLSVVGANYGDGNVADSGAAYVYRWDGSNWAEEQKLIATDGGLNDRFGFSSVIRQDMILVGSYYHNNGTGTGAVYVYQWNGSSWLEEQKLIPSDTAGGDTFGFSMSLSGDVLLVSASDKDNGTGAVYVFRWNGSSWVEEQKLTASDGAMDDEFGFSVSIDGDVALVGSLHQGSAPPGSAYVYRWNGTNWVEEQKLNASDGFADDRFGISVYINGDIALIGASGYNDNNDAIGAAYSYRWNGSSWGGEQKLPTTDGIRGWFASRLSMAEDFALVGYKTSEKVLIFTKNATPTDGNIFDVLPPSGTMEINSNVSYCNAVNVVLTLNSADSAYMSFSNDNSTFTDWELYSNSKSWTLTGGDGTKTVYVKFMDFGWNKTTVNDSIILDTIAPSGNMVIDDGVSYTAEINVTLTLSSVEAVQMAFSNDGLSYGAWQSYLNTKSWTLSAGDGAKTVHARLMDDAGNITELSQSIILDETAPTTTITINSGAAYSNVRDVLIMLDSVDANYMRFSKDGITYSDWQSYSNSKMWMLSDGDGSKTVFAQLKDLAGNTSTVSSDIILDTVAPAGTFAIENGDSYCTDSSVSLNLSFDDADYLSFSNDGVAYGDWEPYADAKNWILSSIDGAKTVYVKLKDHAENESLFSDTIVLDTAAPTGTMVINNDAEFSTTRDISITLASDDADYVCFSNDGISFGDWQSYSTSIDWTLSEGDDTKTVFGKIKDEAGNIENISDTIVLDTTIPNGTFAINAGSSYSMTSDVSLTLDFDDAVEMKFSNDGISYGDWESYLVSKNWVLSGGDGVKSVYLKLKDQAGNVGTFSDTIVLDSLAPNGDLAVNNDAEYSTIPDVTLRLNSDNAAHVCFSNDGNNYSDWEPYTESKTWALSGDDGSKTVYVKFKDEAGNTFVVSHDIILDSTAPNAPILNDLGILDNNQPTLDWEIVGDADHYILEYADNPDFQISEFVDAIGPSEYEITSPLDDGTWYWRVMAVDTAGNESDWSMTGEFVIDTTSFCAYGPEKPVLLSPSNGAVDVSLTPVLNIQNSIDTPVCNYPLKTRWRISKDPNFRGLIAKVNSESKDLTSYQISELILEPNTTYYWKVRILGSQGNNSKWSNVFSFTTQPADVDDSDDDGIIDDQEVDDTDDLDNDGTPDNEQDNEIKSFRAKKGNLKLGMRSSNSDIICIKALRTDSVDNNGNKPDQVPYGLMSYRVEVPQYGAIATIKLFFSEPAPKNAKWVFYDALEGWQDFSEHVSFNDSRTEITVELKDGGYGDNDHTENKIIVDPSGMGIFDDSSSDTGGGGGCFISNIVPW